MLCGLTDHGSSTQLVEVGNESLLADKRVDGFGGGGLVAGGSPDLQTDWADVHTVDDIGEQNAGLIERHRSQKHRVSTLLQPTVRPP